MHGVRQILIHPDYKPSDSSHPGNNDIGMAIFILLFTSLSFFATYLLLRRVLSSAVPFGSSRNALKITLVYFRAPGEEGRGTTSDYSIVIKLISCVKHPNLLASVIIRCQSLRHITPK